MTTRLTPRNHLAKRNLSHTGFCSSATNGRQGRAEWLQILEIILFNALLQHPKCRTKSRCNQLKFYI